MYKVGLFVRLSEQPTCTISTLSYIEGKGKIRDQDLVGWQERADK